MVREVEELSRELQPERLGNREVAEDTEIPVEGPRRPQDSVCRCPNRVVGRFFKRSRVEVRGTRSATAQIPDRGDDVSSSAAA